ncbi:hypothetical protein N7523_008227 [Penicillium sp. IBT 18751x]|nr:hypothetical protein N7523_008227 [Penicillium sp. IBT 18751x]
MDCAASTMPTNACFPARIETHIKNQSSRSSALSHDTMATEDRMPSPRRWSPTYQPRNRSRQFPSSLSFLPSSALARPEQEYTTTLTRRPATRSPVCISPFRSVRRMKEPFQLVLPKSPASTGASPATASCDGSFPKFLKDPPPPAGRRLRTWRSDQNLTVANMSAFGLLPSPPISDSRPASASMDSSSYFECKSDTNSDENTPTQELPEQRASEPVNEPISVSVEDAVQGPVGQLVDDTLDEPMEELMKEPEQGLLGEPTLPFEMEEKIHYKAYRPPGWTRALEERRRTDVTNVHEAHSNLIRQCEKASLHHDKPPTASTSTLKSAKSSIASPQSVLSAKAVVPGTSPRPQRPRTATVSSEASWVPTNFSYCQTWLQGVPFEAGEDKDQAPKEFNRRKFQIVETDPPMPKLDFIPGSKALEEPVVSSSTWVGSKTNHAHVQLQRFAVASKPKLVEVTRQSSPSMPPSTATPIPPPPPLPSLLPHPLPMTPDQRQEEVSAFSPDTPLDMSDSGYGTRESGYSMDSYSDSKDDDAYTDPGSLTSDSVTSTVVCERPESAQGERDRSLQPEIRSGSVSPKASSSPRTASSGHTSNPSEKEEKRRLFDQEWTLDDHEWTLGELDHSVKDFPRHMLRLTSPVIVYLRRNDEKVLLRPFRTIFPQVAENLLDGLCAALIARNYLVSLSTLHRRKPSISTRSDPYTVDAIPAKAYSTLGIQIPTGSPGRMKDRALGVRSMDLRRQVESIIDNLLFAICGRADDTLKSAVEVLTQVLESNVQH